MLLILYVLLNIIITGFAIFLAGKLTSVQIELGQAAICVAIASLLDLIPGVGWLISLIVFFFLLKKFTRVDVWPDLIILVIISKLISFLISFILF